MGELVVRRLRYLPEITLQMLRLAATLGDAVSMRELSAVARLPTPDVVLALAEAFRAQLLDDEGDTLIFRHQLVHARFTRRHPRRFGVRSTVTRPRR